MVISSVCNVQGDKLTQQIALYKITSNKMPKPWGKKVTFAGKVHSSGSTLAPSLKIVKGKNKVV